MIAVANNSVVVINNLTSRRASVIATEPAARQWA